MIEKVDLSVLTIKASFSNILRASPHGHNDVGTTMVPMLCNLLYYFLGSFRDPSSSFIRLLISPTDFGSDDINGGSKTSHSSVTTLLGCHNQTEGRISQN